MSTTPNTNSRRSEAQLRNEHLAKGAMLLKFTANVPTSQSVVNKWHSIEKKGFLVSTDGCLIPHQVHWFANEQRLITSQLAVEFFHSKQVNPVTKDKVNKHGWPCAEEFSHLCHYSACASPSHVIIEPSWKICKRNYCGYHGSCDCGNQPPCLRTYHNKDFDHKLMYLSYSTPNLAERLRQLFPSAKKIEILPKSYYANEDKKRANRLLRRKRQRKHLKQAKTNRTKQQRKQ